MGMPLWSVRETCAGCPSQWDAVTTGNRRVMIHYRENRLTVQLDGEYIFDRVVEGESDGVISWDRVKRLTGLRDLNLGDLECKFSPQMP